MSSVEPRSIDPAAVTVLELDPLAPPTAILQISDSDVRLVGLPNVGSGADVPTTNDPVVDWFTGVGPPPTPLIGAGKGDMYIDVSTGTLYQLR